jgi:hypothetical protein
MDEEKVMPYFLYFADLFEIIELWQKRTIEVRSL